MSRTLDRNGRVRSTARVIASVLASMLAGGTELASAQQRAAAPAQKTAARPNPAAAAPAGGLAGLSDDALLAELAGRQMQGLLDYAFEANKVPEQQRLSMMAIPAIARLGDTANPPKEPERVRLMNQIVAGADRIIAGARDTQALMEYSAALIKFGVEPEVNVMEYWGETPKVQNRLRPIIGTVMGMLDKAVVSGTAARAKLEEQLDTARTANVEKAWTAADNLVTTAEFTRAMVKYNEAMAVPPGEKGNESRKKLADGAIEFLQTYDNADSGVQTAVRNRMAKLNMVKREFGPANDLFETVVSGQVDEKTKITPPPSPFEQYEARYFSVVCELMTLDIPRAQKGLQDLIEWQQKAVPDPKAQEGLTAAADMLQYRIYLKQRDRTKDPAQRKAAEDKAFAVLAALNEKRPDLRAIIAEQLIDVMGDKVDVNTAEPVVLEALVTRGAQDVEGVENPAAADPAVVSQINLAVDAARALMTRKDPKITPQMASRAAIQLPLTLEKVGRKAEAAGAYLDYVEKKQGTEKNVKAAFDQAGYLLYTLIKDGADKEDPAVAKAWERYLPIAVNTFGRRELAFDLANRLRSKNPPQFAEAVKFFRLVPATDKRIATARFREMITLTDWVYAVGPDKKPLLKPAEKAAKIQETLKVAGDVRKLAGDALASSKAPAEKAALRSRIAAVTLTQAELAALGEKPDWQLVIKLLEGFETQSAGLENENTLNLRVMELRVASYFQLKQFNQAADVLIALLEKSPGGRAAGLVLGVLRRLNEDYDRSVAAGKAEEAAEVLSYRARLSGRLVEWASANPDANVKKNLYTYKVYDAETQRLFGASLKGDEQTKTLQEAMQSYKTLRSPENLAAYKAVVEERKKDNPRDKTDPNSPDPLVTLGMSLTSYDLKDWKTASTELKKLSFAGKLGSRSRSETDAKTGETKVVPNEQYWDAMAKYYDATRQWAASDATSADAQAELNAVKTLLRRDYVAGPEEAGGLKSRGMFETLRKELIPDLDIEAIRNAAPSDAAPSDGTSSQPASQPTSEPTSEPESLSASQPVAPRAENDGQ